MKEIYILYAIYIFRFHNFSSVCPPFEFFYPLLGYFKYFFGVASENLNDDNNNR